MGLALKRGRVARRVIGFSRHEATIRRAKAVGAVDDGCTELCPEWLGESDLVIIATPPLSVVPLARRIAKMTRHSFVLTDVASTKRRIVRDLERDLPSRIRFAGSHPMAGSEQSGIDAAKPALFKGAVCVLTRTPRTSPSALEALRSLWRAVGSKIVVLTPEKHDKLVAQISHVPHIAAAVLVELVSAEALRLAGTGFRDATRIAKSDPAMWEQIIRTNREPVSCSLGELVKRLSQIRRSLGNPDGLRRRFRKAQIRRRSLG